jgi:hypothetical protein
MVKRRNDTPAAGIACGRDHLRPLILILSESAIHCTHVTQCTDVRGSARPGGRRDPGRAAAGEQQEQQQQQEIPGKIRTSTARRNAVFLASAAAVRTFPDTKRQQQHDSGLQRNGDMLK